MSKKCKHEFRIAKVGGSGENWRIPYIYYCTYCLLMRAIYKIVYDK